MRLELQASSPERPLQPKLLLLDPGDNCVDSLELTDLSILGTHELENGGTLTTEKSAER